VTDVGGNLVGDHTSLTVYGSALHPGIRTEAYVGTQGQAQTFHMVVLDLNGEPVARQAVSVQIVNQQWFSVAKQDANGVSQWVTSVKNIPVSTVSAVTDADGLAQWLADPQQQPFFDAVRLDQIRAQDACQIKLVSRD